MIERTAGRVGTTGLRALLALVLLGVGMAWGAGAARAADGSALVAPQSLYAISGTYPVGGRVAGPPNAVVEVQLATGPTCTRAMAGDDVTVLPVGTVQLDELGGGNLSIPVGELTLGWSIWGTTTSGGVTTEPGPCSPVLSGPATSFRITGATATSVMLSWTPTPGASNQVIEVQRRDRSVLRKVHVGSASTAAITDLGTSYQYGFRIHSADPSTSDFDYALTGLAIPPFRNPADLTDQQFLDFARRHATIKEAFTWADELLDGEPTVRVQILRLARQPYWAGARDPIIRLYLASFGRLPDRAGLDHWSARRRAGVPIRQVAAAFMASSEFRAKYGSLSSTQFVQRVYLNVVHRSADPSGLAYWVKRLDARSITRTDLLVSFSEGSEHVRRTAAAVSTVDVVGAMLQRMPTSDELATWAPPTGTPPDPADLVLEILGSPAYGARLR